ncbi:MAG: heme-binding protein [Methylobacter sp.]
MPNSNTQPNLTIPLINEPAQTSPGTPSTALGPLEYLIGTWTNQSLSGSMKGDPQTPYSYNVMPLPQVDPSSPTGYILKNFAYYEELTFSAIHGNAPNRGGTGTQVANTLFYEQRVYFAEGPNKDALVHAENGSLLFLTDQKQALGPYGNGDQPGLGDLTVQNSVPPTQQFNIAKQVSVPHGNSILAPGHYQNSNGSPQIPPASTLPGGVDTTQYKTPDPVANPNPAYTLNPNQALVDALAVNRPTSFIQLDVGTQNHGGGITNIGFEQQHALVEWYCCTYWLEALNGSQNFTQLQYSQSMLMQIPIAGKGVVSFPHVTTNTLTKVS